MRASQVLQKCLCDSLEPMHALREVVLLRSVEALIAAQRLTLTDVARAWPGAQRASRHHSRPLIGCSATSACLMSASGSTRISRAGCCVGCGR